GSAVVSVCGSPSWARSPEGSDAGPARRPFGCRAHGSVGAAGVIPSPTWLCPLLLCVLRPVGPEFSVRSTGCSLSAQRCGSVIGGRAWTFRLEKRRRTAAATGKSPDYLREKSPPFSIGEVGIPAKTPDSLAERIR